MTEGSQSGILVVDDGRESALITRGLLRGGNYERMDIGSGGLEALRMCGITPGGEDDSTAEHPYQLVVLDTHQLVLVDMHLLVVLYLP